jgi:hypothetical protein
VQSFSLIDFSVTDILQHFCPLQGHFCLTQLHLTGINAERILLYENQKHFFVVLMLSLPAISAEHSEMKMSDMSHQHRHRNIWLA